MPPIERKGSWLGKAILEVTLPWPIRALPQADLAEAPVPVEIWARLQVGRPLAERLPWELISREIRLRRGGTDLLVVLIEPLISTVTGAGSVRGRVEGRMPPSKETCRTPFWERLAWASGAQDQRREDRGADRQSALLVLPLPHG